MGDDSMPKELKAYSLAEVAQVASHESVDCCYIQLPFPVATLAWHGSKSEPGTAVPLLPQTGPDSVDVESILGLDWSGRVKGMITVRTSQLAEDMHAYIPVAGEILV
jgi:hypothetical protein